MTIVIGTDEAGYGPNLGPLVVAASAWRVPDALGVCDLYEALGDCVCRAANDSQSRLAIADSKVLYKPGGSLAGLERAVFAALGAAGHRPGCWRDVWSTMANCRFDTANQLPWHADYDEPAPLDCAAEETYGLCRRFTAGGNGAGIELLGVRATAVFPAQFNRRVRQLGSKGALLTESTLRLAEELIEQHAAAPTFVLCDKHGGRNRYAAALQHIWPDSWISIVREGRAESVYRLHAAEREIEFRFAVGGESHLPCALASMAAKYLRELAMRALNAFWQKQVPNLKPTAGYPTDARRFKQDIAAAQRRLGIDDEILWRCR